MVGTMHRGARKRRIVALPVAIVAVLSLVLQVAAAPCLFFAPADGLAPGSICHAATDDAGSKAPQPMHGCQCSCPLCQVTTAAWLLPPAPPRLPAPSVTAAPAVTRSDTGALAAAWAAYASRAPPAIG